MTPLRSVALLLALVVVLSVGVTAKRSAEPYPFGDLTVVPIGHAALVLTSDVTPEVRAVYVDPATNAADYDGLPAPDVVLVTHAHGDHFVPALILELVTATTLVVAPADVLATLVAAGYTGPAFALANNETVEIGSGAALSVEAVAAYNYSPGREQLHPFGVWNGYVVRWAGQTVYVSGDTEDVPEMRALQGVTVAFVCMNLPYTMSVDQAADGVLAFKPLNVFPYHYRDSNVTEFKALVEAGGSGVNVILAEWY